MNAQSVTVCSINLVPNLGLCRKLGKQRVGAVVNPN